MHRTIPGLRADEPLTGDGADATCHVSHLDSGLHAVRISGRLPPGWIGAFSLACSPLGIDIRQGFARRPGPSRWTSEFLVASAAGSPAVERMDFLALARQESAAAPLESIGIDRYVIRRPHLASSELELEVEGRDQIGFLGSLLKRLALLALFPHEVEIETRGDIVSDRFLVSSLGGRRPSQEALDALEAMLEGQRLRA